MYTCTSVISIIVRYEVNSQTLFRFIGQKAGVAQLVDVFEIKATNPSQLASD